MVEKRVLLPESDLPAAWYNVAADLPEPPAPIIHPRTREPVGRGDLEPIFGPTLVSQEYSRQRWVEIPEGVRSTLAAWRPTPLVRATGLERHLKTPARIYFKDESQSPTGSHKLNTAVAQLHYARREGIRRVVTETGAGQWGCSVALAGSWFGLACRVFMVRLTHDQKPYRRTMIRLWGADVTPSPSDCTEVGRRVLAEEPDSPGCVGIAIGEAMETAAGCPETRYCLGSVLNHVLLHQTVIGLETEKQLALAGERPDVMIGCVGGGSNFAGLVFPQVPRVLDGEEIRLVAVEPRACATVSEGRYQYDHCDTAGLAPLVRMFTLGHGFVPPRIQAGGLRYHGMAPLVSQLAYRGIVEAEACGERESFQAARTFAAVEGIVPAVETSYAIRAVIDEALRCRETGQAKCIVFVLSGHGLCDLGCYDRYLRGELVEDGVWADPPEPKPAAAG